MIEAVEMFVIFNSKGLLTKKKHKIFFVLSVVLRFQCVKGLEDVSVSAFLFWI